ncbi:MAG: sterol desaturase family protein [Stagnimonas sp.]|nr:sterol desaturase family protein [Stagnimonas sp.]
MTLEGAVQMTMAAMLRTAPVLLVLAALLFAERRWPWRAALPRHWAGNLLLGGLSFLSVLVLPLASMTAAAQWAAAHDFGLLNQLAMPQWLRITLAVVALDLALYAQHRALHTGPLWALHRVHHLDPMLDVTSGVRFHPLEAGASALYKSLVVLLLGAPVAAAGLSALLTLLGSLFTHANIRLPSRVERWLRKLVVTPALHRIHHSTVSAETQSNFGSVLWVWDHLFGSAKPRSSAGEALQLGVANLLEQTTIAKMLLEPFHRRPVQ